MRALPDGDHATPLDLPAVADLDSLVYKVAGRVAPGSVIVGHSLGGVVAANSPGRAAGHSFVRPRSLLSLRLVGDGHPVQHSSVRLGVPIEIRRYAHISGR